MFKNGYISSYFLYLLIVVTTLIASLTLSLQYRIKSLYNLKISSEYLMQESIILNFVKCELYKNTLESNSYNVDGLNFNVNINNDKIYIYVNSKYSQNIIIEYKIEEEVISINDYHTYTDLSLALDQLTNRSNLLK